MRDADKLAKSLRLGWSCMILYVHQTMILKKKNTEVLTQGLILSLVGQWWIWLSVYHMTNPLSILWSLILCERWVWGEEIIMLTGQTPRFALDSVNSGSSWRSWSAQLGDLCIIARLILNSNTLKPKRPWNHPGKTVKPKHQNPRGLFLNPKTLQMLVSSLDKWYI